MDTLKKAAWKATGGGLAGAAAMFVNVGTLMWMRTTVNFQYRYGMGTMEAIRHLYKDGGIRRFYQGVGPALFQGPLSRFVSEMGPHRTHHGLLRCGLNLF